MQIERGSGVAISEENRHQMYKRLEEVLGREQAATLMEHLPPVGWADVATKRDLDHLAAVTKRDLDHLAAVTKRDLDHVAGALDAKIDHVAGLLDTKIDRLGDQLRAEWRGELHRQTLALVMANAAMVGAVVAALKLG
jgi:hypothetical protein